MYEKADNSNGMKGTEILSKSTDIHPGHVFNDDPNDHQDIVLMRLCWSLYLGKMAQIITLNLGHLI